MTQDVIITPASGKIEFKNNAVVAATIVLDAANGRLNVPDTNTFHFLNATGTAPFIVDSTTKVANLNSDLLDGLSSGSFLRSNASDTYTSGTLTIANEAIVEFNMADGTAPFTVASTTKVSNLNADLLDGLSSGSFASSTASPALTLSGDATGTATFTNLGNATLSVVVTNDSHTHDTRYFTESEVSIAMARSLGWVNGYGNTVDASVYYDFAEQAVVIDKLTTVDDSIGAVHKAVRVIAGEVVRYTLLLKADASHTSGLYIRLYGYTGDLPDGKTHVSNNASSSSSFVEEDDFQDTAWVSNSAVGTGWITYEYEYTVPTTGYVSLVILNWTGTGADGKIWVKQPDIVIIKSASSANSDELQGFTWTETGKNVLGDEIQVGTATTYFYEDAAGRISTSADFYVRADSANTYLYSANTYLGATSGDSILLRGNTISGTSWSITGAGAAVFDSVSEGGTALSAKYLGISSKAADSDKLDALNSTDFVRYIATPAASASNLLASGAWITSWSTAGNIDHVWHDDTSNQWNFNSDTTLYAQGNSIINGGSYKVGNVQFIDGSRNISANEIVGTFGEFTNDTDALRVRSTTTGVGVNINFSDQVPTPSQQGNITYFHQDTLSYGSGNAFVISGTEASMTILADGKLMFNEGIYSKPASGTGAGTQVIDSSRNLTNIGTISVGQTSNSLGASFEALGTDAKVQVHYLSNSRGGIAAFSTQRIALYTTSSFDDIVFGYSTDATGASFVQKMKLDNGTGELTVSGVVTASGGNSGNWNTAYTVANAALPKAGGTMTGTLDFNNNALTNLNNLTFNDPGPDEGIQWLGGNGWKIYESPDDLTTNTGGNLQFVTGTTLRFTIVSDGRLNIRGPMVSYVATGIDILSWTGGGIRKMTDQGGVSIGADSSVMLHAGDSRASWATFFGIGATTTTETLYCTADGAVQVVTNMQAGAGSQYTSTFGNDGSLSVPGTITSGGQELVSGNVTGTLFADVISANEIYADMIAANAITAQKITANAITADKLEISSSASVADSIFFDGTNKRIDIKDASNVLRVRIGQL